jgi:putative addiction module component (TIGR02574 family)
MAATDMLTEMLRLPPEERARLALELLRSLDGEPDADAASAWDAEIERRGAEVDAGTADTMTLDEYRAHIRARRAARAARCANPSAHDRGDRSRGRLLRVPATDYELECDCERRDERPPSPACRTSARSARIVERRGTFLRHSPNRDDVVNRIVDVVDEVFRPLHNESTHWGNCPALLCSKPSERIVQARELISSLMSSSGRSSNQNGAPGSHTSVPQVCIPHGSNTAPS